MSFRNKILLLFLFSYYFLQVCGKNIFSSGASEDALEGTLNTRELSSSPSRTNSNSYPTPPQRLNSLKSFRRQNSQKVPSSSSTAVAIYDHETLKERGKELIINNMTDPNFNKAMTCLAHDVKTILQNQYSSKIIIDHVHMFRVVLTNNHAKNMITDIRLRIAKYLIDKETAKEVSMHFIDYGKHLADPEVPMNFIKKAIRCRDVFGSPAVRTAVTTVSDSLLDFMKQPNCVEKIVQMFQQVSFRLNSMA